MCYRTEVLILVLGINVRRQNSLMQFGATDSVPSLSCCYLCDR
jgi:hypothetical protein